MSRFQRRQFLIAAGALASPWLSMAQSTGAMARIGFLGGGSASAAVKPLEGLRNALRQLGYVEGKSISIEYRWGDGKQEGLLGLARELVRLKVQLIAAWTTPATLAAQRATSTLPIVMVGVGDPVVAGFVESLARPGGNITGMSNLDVGLTKKRLELLRPMLPKLSQIAVLRNPSDPNNDFQYKDVQDIARSMNIEEQPFDVRDREGFEGAFTAMAKARVDAVFVLAGALFITHRKQIADFALKNRLPSVFARSENVEAGGLMSYGSELTDIFAQAARFIDKILRGAKPADLPVEQPTKYTTVINSRTAKALGLSVPSELLVRADRVIE